MKFLKATFHLQLVQNIGCVPCAVQYILEPVLHSIACTSHSAHPCRPAPLLHWLPLVCSLYLWVCLFVMFTSLSCFFDSTYKWYHIVWVFLCLVYFTESVCVWACVLVTQSCPTLCDPMGCSLPDSPVHGILQARILEWVAIPFSRVSSLVRDQNPNFLHYRFLQGKTFTYNSTLQVHPCCCECQTFILFFYDWAVLYIYMYVCVYHIF